MDRIEITQKAVEKLTNSYLQSASTYAEEISKVYVDIFAEGFSKIIDQHIESAKDSPVAEVVIQVLKSIKKSLAYSVKAYNDIERKPLIKGAAK